MEIDEKEYIGKKHWEDLLISAKSGVTSALISLHHNLSLRTLCENKVKEFEDSEVKEVDKEIESVVQ